MASHNRVSVRVLAPHSGLTPERLTVLLLMDGNNRWNKQRVDYGAGERKLLEVARYLAVHARVGAAVACVASSDNVSKRSPAFFRALRAALLEFGAAIEGGELPGVRVEIVGGLSRLRLAGGEAVSCADAFEALARATAEEQAPRLELMLAVDYARDLTRRTVADLVVRTGMEREGLIRGSGLDAMEAQMWYGTTTLWPDLDIGELGAAIDRCLLRRVRTFSGGFSAVAVGELLQTLARADRDLLIDMTIPVQAITEDVRRTLEGLYAGSRNVNRRVATYHVGQQGEAPRRYGKLTPRRHVLRVAADPLHRACDFEVLVVPGQDASGVMLPSSLRLGYAHILPCAATVEAIVSVALSGARDARKSPPLRGADRVNRPDAASSRQSEEALRRLEPLVGFVAARRGTLAELASALPEDARAGLEGRDPVESVFAAEVLHWTVRTGLCLDIRTCPGALAYIRTAYHMFPDPAVATIVARYMMLAAVGDVFVFDRIADDESQASRLLRLEVSATYLIDAIRGGDVPGPPPNVTSAPYLASIAAQWVELRARLEDRAHVHLLRAWCAGATGLYEGSVREHLPEVTDNPLVELLVTDRAAAHALMARYISQAPRAISARLAELFDACVKRPSRVAEVELELRVILYLIDVNTIGAGLAVRTAALTVDRAQVPAGGPQSLDEVLPLLDYRVRLANDLSDFVASFGHDRDNKKNACSLLVPKEASGVGRAVALMRAVGVIRRVARFLDAALDESLTQLSTIWPAMATCVRRGRHIGVTTYEVGHFTTVAESELDAIVEGAIG